MARDFIDRLFQRDTLSGIFPLAFYSRPYQRYVRTDKCGGGFSVKKKKDLCYFIIVHCMALRSRITNIDSYAQSSPCTRFMMQAITCALT